MTRLQLIRRIIRDVYGGQPTDDASVTDNLVNLYINDGIAVAVKNHYKENMALEGVSCINNSFYLTYKGLSLTEDSGNTGYWKCSLPQIPYGLGKSEGIKSIKILSGANLSYPVYILDANQWEYVDSLPQPNGVFAKNEGDTLLFKMQDGLGILLYQTTATVTLISGGDSTNLNSTLNVPDEWIGTIQQYVVGVLVFERAQPKDNANDGSDN